ncbi:MAG: chemotaxis protein CheW [Planctomycetota bacterium]
MNALALTSTSDKRLASFRLNDEWYGVDVLKVQEVLLDQVIAAVPRSREYVRGLMNVRGLIVTCLSLKARLGMKRVDYDDDHAHVIVPVEGGAISLMVDEVGDVIDVASQHATDAPPTIEEVAAEFVTGVHRLEQCLLIELDVDRICSSE